MAETLVYLAGPITGISYGDATDWRAYFQSLVTPSIRCLSPMRGAEWLQSESCLPNSYTQSEKRPLATDKAIVARDYLDVRRAQLVVMNLLGAKIVSIGTVIEAGWAHAHRVPILGVIEETGNIHEHGMLRELFGWRIDSLEEAARMVHLIV